MIGIGIVQRKLFSIVRRIRIIVDFSQKVHITAGAVTHVLTEKDSVGGA
jgi:hypothetical protein